MFNNLKAFLLTVAVYLGLHQMTNGERTRKMGDAANVSTHHLSTIALTIVIVIVGAYLAVTVISSLLPTYAGGIKNISNNFTTADWGNATANSLGSVFGLVISLVGMFAMLGLVLLGVSLYKGKKGGV